VGAEVSTGAEIVTAEAGTEEEGDCISYCILKRRTAI